MRINKNQNNIDIRKNEIKRKACITKKIKMDEITDEN